MMDEDRTGQSALNLAPSLLTAVEQIIVPELPMGHAERVRAFCRQFLQRSSSGDKQRNGPVRQTFRLLGDKWTTLVVMVLHYGTMRYALLHKFVSLLSLEGGEHGISQRMLTLVLHNLEFNGLVARSSRGSAALRVEYSLTPLGESLHGQLLGLVEWAEQHTDQILSARRAHGGDSIDRASSVRPAAPLQ
jgi:DNA-binding HxlR family transcriptional regulator